MAIAPVEAVPSEIGRLPSWIKTRPPSGAKYLEVRSTVEELRIGTVCQEARCPNLPECWSSGTATIMLLGTECTRRCSFCAVRTHWPGGAVDIAEPNRVAEAVGRWGLAHVVLTQVCRDDLADGGASLLARTVRGIHASSPATTVELLLGDLGGSESALRTVLESRPEVLAHNVETVERVSPGLRDRRAGYRRSLELFERVRAISTTPPVTKSSIMLGVGETDEELLATFRDLRSVRVELLTLGQYLRPSSSHRRVDRYVTPEEFDRYRRSALSAGFVGVEAGPLVRSSYHAQELYRRALAR